MKKAALKKALSILLAFCILTGITGIALPQISLTATASAGAAVTASNCNVNAGASVNIPISITNNPGIMGFLITLTYDSTVLTPVSVTGTTLLSAGSLEDSIGYSPAGTVTIVWNGTQDMASDGIMLNVEFTAGVSASGTSQVQISYSRENTFDEQYNDVVLTCGSFNIVISNINPLISAANAAASAGATVNIPVNIINSNGFAVSVITVTYDSTKLTPTAVTAGKAAVISSNPGSVPGTLTVVLNTLAASAGNGTLFTIRFSVPEKVSGVTAVSLTSSAGIACVNGSVTITDPNASQPVKIYANNISSGILQSVTIPIRIDNNHGIMGFKLTFNYDSELLEPVSAERGTALSSGMIESNIGVRNDGFDVVWNSTADNLNDGELLLIKFNVRDLIRSANTSIKITYSSEDTFNEKWQDVAFNCSDVSVKLSALTVSESYILGVDPRFSGSVTDFNDLLQLEAGEYLNNYTPFTGTYAGTGTTLDRRNSSDELVSQYTCVVLGDVNGDSVVDVLDAFFIQLQNKNGVTLTGAFRKASDLNKDGQYNDTDFSLALDACVQQ